MHRKKQAHAKHKFGEYNVKTWTSFTILLLTWLHRHVYSGFSCDAEVYRSTEPLLSNPSPSIIKGEFNVQDIITLNNQLCITVTYNELKW